jgi:8-oxo-dGTP pyrophosphatase MutT (NUDIX family)
VQTTWDGLPVTDEPPFGATVVVYRVRDDGVEVLMLHRAHHGPAYTGDWAWTPPAGARLPGEPVEECAHRELREETGLALVVEPSRCGTDEWWVYLADAPPEAAVVNLADAPPEAAVVIDAEHDRFEWLPVELASARCAPEMVRAPLLAAIAQIRHRLTDGTWNGQGLAPGGQATASSEGI